MMETGLSPMISAETDKAWKSLHYIATHSERGVEKQRVAPKSDIERRIETLMQQFGYRRQLAIFGDRRLNLLACLLLLLRLSRI